MVARDIDEFIGPRTLCDWVKNFRIKKCQMKRKLRCGRGSDGLRVCAILSTALLSAEHELRRKQQERFSRWVVLQAKFNLKLGRRTNDDNSKQQTSSSITSSDASSDGVESAVVATEQQCKQREEITNLWKCELSDLDEFMRSMSSHNNSEQPQAITVTN